LGLFEPICCGCLLPHLDFREWFLPRLQNPQVGLRSAHLLSFALLLSFAVALDSLCGALTFCISGACFLSPKLSVYSTKVMACYSPLSEIVAANVAEAENLDVVDNLAGVVQTIGGGEVSGASDGKGHSLSARRTDDFTDGGASDDENSRTYYFGASTITLGKIKEMVEKGYFAECEA
jgi:hypothetical protein